MINEVVHQEKGEEKKYMRTKEEAVTAAQYVICEMSQTKEKIRSKQE